jgi:hypothetical protein
MHLAQLRNLLTLMRRYEVSSRVNLLKNDDAGNESEVKLQPHSHTQAPPMPPN